MNTQPANTESMRIVQALQTYAIEFEKAAHEQKLSPEFTLMIVERQIIQAALDRNKGNQCKAAKELGWHRNTLARRMIELKLMRCHERHGHQPRRKDGLPDYRKRVVVREGERFPIV